MSKARGLVSGLAAAALFGASAPLTKKLLSSIDPLPLAALLYLGAGIALSLTRLVQRRGAKAEAPLARADAPTLLAVIALGGMLGPILMVVGLARVSGLSGALLLNLEAPFTMIFAVTLFREHLGKMETAAAALIVLGALALSFGPGPWRADAVGVSALAGACAAWGLDNNFSQKLSGKDPLAVVHVKTLSAGTGTLVLGFAFGQKFPDATMATAAAALGAASYGLSLVLDMRALRFLGAAREAAIFATAPFIGAALAIPVLGERPSPAHAIAGLCMLAGVGLVVRARHGHVHTHDVLEHEHVHVHDAHHQHDHQDVVTEPHSHPHRHVSLTHNHAHVSDAHHRHKHG